MIGSSETTPRDIRELVDRARAAMHGFSTRGQKHVDMAVRALAWAVYEPDRASRLAEIAVEETGFGNVESKIQKNRRKTFGALRDLMHIKTVGLLEENPATGIIRYGKPVGVVGAICPSTNPTATPVNKAMMAVKGGNAVIVSPSPGSWRASSTTVSMMRDELRRCGAPPDLVQVLPRPITRDRTQALIKSVNLAVVTGSERAVGRAMTSGTVTIGVGSGNVPVIVDSCADLADAAVKIAASKCFDNATSCSSENAVILLDDVYHPALRALEEVGGWLCSADESRSIASVLWRDGLLNRDVIAKDAKVAAGAFGLPKSAAKARFFLVEEPAVGGPGSFADEKLSLVLTVYRAMDFAHAVEICEAILRVRGEGHSVGIHTRNTAHARELAERLNVVRVLVNQAHCLSAGGSFENALPFTLSLGGGTWAASPISENLNARHFINITYLVHCTPEDKPSESDLFAPLWMTHAEASVE